MPEQNKTYRIFLSAAEPSGDAHCAGLINALKQSTYDIDFVGVGGQKMAEAGCKLIETTTTKAAMMYKAFRHVFHFYKLIKRITSFLKSNNVDLVIVCDSPAFNFHVAKAAKKANIKTLFYIAPQLWAWAGWRIVKLRKYCDKLCCGLPFEQEWFSKRGIDVVFVGNPMLDQLDLDLTTCRKQYADFEPENACFALMPGSRPAEIGALWVPMQEIAVRLKQKYANADFTAVAVDADRREVLEASKIPGFECKYAIASVNDAAQAADFAIVASGSATLQVAAAGCPMVIMYQSSRVLWHLVGRWIVRTKYLSLVNILAGKELVPEFMPYFGSIEPILGAMEGFLADREGLVRVSGELVELVRPLAENKACEQVGQKVVEMLP
ncbi:MAG: lipid-A-disaccharide synthase [Planctomycetota bacterium]|nr:MAG: lipid-A-disaccharide synthase [Planctomycetota bacterium]